MLSPLEDAVMDAINRAVDPGIAMGALVDGVMAEGAKAEDVEVAIWALLQRGRAVSGGFICRVVRKRDAGGQLFDLRTYEVLLTAAPTTDSQLDLGLEGKP
jgi:hypothetical protein